MGARILVIDNYDSFVFNLVQYLAQLDAEVTVTRNDDITATQAAGYDGILISPGPGTPEDAGRCIEVVEQCSSTTPILGVCLGHQAIAVAFGGVVDRAPELLHGKTSLIHHGGAGLFAGLPEPFTATRYHSLAMDPRVATSALQVTAWTDSGVVMGVAHREYQVSGVQFHPESVLTEGGHRLLANWLATCGDAGAVARSVGLGPLVAKS